MALNRFLFGLNVKIYTGTDFEIPVLTCTVVSVHVPTLYFTYNDSELKHSCYDYALLYVAEDLSNYGMFELGVMQDAFLENAKPVIASGFPGVVYGFKNVNGARYFSTGKMGEFDVKDSIITYPESCDQRFHATTVISAGDSGRPVYAVTKY